MRSKHAGDSIGGAGRIDTAACPVQAVLPRRPVHTCKQALVHRQTRSMCHTIAPSGCMAQQDRKTYTWSCQQRAGAIPTAQTNKHKKQKTAATPQELCCAHTLAQRMLWGCSEHTAMIAAAAAALRSRCSLGSGHLCTTGDPSRCQLGEVRAHHLSPSCAALQHLLGHFQLLVWQRPLQDACKTLHSQPSLDAATPVGWAERPINTTHLGR